MEESSQIHAPTDLAPGKEPPYPLDRILGGAQSRCGRGGEDKNPCPCQESNPSRSTRNLVTVLTELPLLLTALVAGKNMKSV
jgi:hypothetical protein